MELRHLRYFLVVAETLNVSKAAVRLRVTQPALSRQIHDLERELGSALFERKGGRTELTHAGREFLKGTREILNAVELLQQRTRAAAHDETSRIRLGHYGALWIEYFSKALRRFSRQHPSITAVSVELSPAQLAQALRRGELDLALLGMVDDGLRREFNTRLICTLPWTIAMAVTHPFAKHRKLDLTQLKDCCWLAWPEKEFPGRTRHLVEACLRAGFKPNIVGEADGQGSMLARISTSRCVTCVLPMSRTQPHDGVVFADLKAGGIPFEMHAAWPREPAPCPAVRAMVEILAETERVRTKALD